MCRTIHALLTVVICGIQMLVRVFMTLILMIENVIRMFLQTLYNFISFLLQLISLIPICCVFFATSRLKCFMCGGGGPCPVRRGGGCDCLMSAVAIIILFFIFRATGVLDKIFYSIGYAKAAKQVMKYSPTPGTITECSRNDSFVTNATTPQMKPGITGEISSSAIETDPDATASDMDNESNTDTISADGSNETIDATAKTTTASTDDNNEPVDEILESENATIETPGPNVTKHRVDDISENKTQETVENLESESSEKTNQTISEIKTREPVSKSITLETPNKNAESETSEKTNQNTTSGQNRRFGDEKLFSNDNDQIDEETQANTTKADEDTIILYYDDDTQISDNNITVIKNDDSRDKEIEQEDMISSENENMRQVSKSALSGKVTLTLHDKNFEKLKLKGWLETTISYYMV